jgi:hypothetical protein
MELSPNTYKLLDEAKKLLASKLLGIKTDFSATTSSWYILNFKIQYQDELQSKLS